MSRVIARPGRITGTASAGLPPKPRAARAAATVSSNAARTLVPSTLPEEGLVSAATGPSQIALSCWNGSNSAAARAGEMEIRASRVGRIGTITAAGAGSTSQRPRSPLGRIDVQRGRTQPRSDQYRFAATVSPGAGVPPRRRPATTPSRAAAAAYMAVGKLLGTDASAMIVAPPTRPTVAHGRYCG